MVYADPFVGKQAVKDMLVKTKELAPPDFIFVLDRVGDGTKCCGFTWHIEYALSHLSPPPLSTSTPLHRRHTLLLPPTCGCFFQMFPSYDQKSHSFPSRTARSPRRVVHLTGGVFSLIPTLSFYSSPAHFPPSLLFTASEPLPIASYLSAVLFTRHIFRDAVRLATRPSAGKFANGMSMYELDDEGKICYVRDLVEPFPKTGDFGLRLANFIGKFV